MKHLGNEWKNLPEDKKEMYKQKSREKNEEYKKQLLEWEEKMIRTDNLDVIRNKDHLENIPKKKYLKRNSTEN